MVHTYIINYCGGTSGDHKDGNPMEKGEEGKDINMQYTHNRLFSH